MKDLRDYSDQELSLMVMNDEYLYNERHNTLSLMDFIEEYFLYTTEQMAVLEQDLSDDLQEFQEDSE